MKKYLWQLAKPLLLVTVGSVLYLTDSFIYFLLSGKPFSCTPTVTKVLQLSNILSRKTCSQIGCIIFPETFCLSPLLVWIHKNSSQKQKENLILERINRLVRLMQMGGGMAVCSAGEVGPFPAFFSTIWRRKRKKKKLSCFSIPDVGRQRWEILVTRQQQFGEFCLGFLLVYCDNNLSSFGSCPCGKRGFLGLWKCASPV